jgi:hypothetical protein
LHSSSCRIFLRLCRWRQYIPQKLHLNFNRLHGIIFQKTVLLATTAVRTKRFWLRTHEDFLSLVTLFCSIFAKRKHLGITLPKMCWLLCLKSKLSISNKLLVYTVILKPIWTYGIQLWAQLPSPTSKYWNASKGKSCA